MSYHFSIKLRHKMPARKYKLGMDTTVYRAESEKAAIAQFLSEMRDCAEYASQYWAMHGCYPNPKDVLGDDII